jgi:septal ring factor EnvC (AmiA/AmiB activator)
MSNTPRTDANERETDTGWLVVGSDFSRQLETELAEVEKKAFAYKTALELSETELAEARAEIENKQYTITCASEENQQLKESLAEARAEIESLTRSLTIVANWKNVKRTYTADEVKEFARGILDVAAFEAAERGE